MEVRSRNVIQALGLGIHEPTRWTYFARQPQTICGLDVIHELLVVVAWSRCFLPWSLTVQIITTCQLGMGSSFQDHEPRLTYWDLTWLSFPQSFRVMPASPCSPYQWDEFHELMSTFLPLYLFDTQQNIMDHQMTGRTLNARVHLTEQKWLETATKFVHPRDGLHKCQKATNCVAMTVWIELRKIYRTAWKPNWWNSERFTSSTPFIHLAYRSPMWFFIRKSQDWECWLPVSLGGIISHLVNSSNAFLRRHLVKKTFTFWITTKIYSQR